METWNADYLDRLYALWKRNPDAVSSDWRKYFKGFDLAADDKGPGETCTEDQALRQARVEALIYRYRDIGHLLSCLDPLVSCPTQHPLLDLPAFDLGSEDMDLEFHTGLFPDRGRATLKEIMGVLRETYCRGIGVEYMHLQDPEERAWLQGRMEPVLNRPDPDTRGRLRILEKLCQSDLFEAFLNKKFPGQTRFSLEGAEVLIPMLDVLVDHAAALGVTEIILGMSHRGRLNVQANVMMKSYKDIFCEFENSYDPASIHGAGDVKYHKGYLGDIDLPGGKTVRMALMSNPSHLESVDPVVEGFAHARQILLADRDQNRVLPLLLHGDAAFAGQGIVSEVLNMSRLDGYRTGGTIHLVVNNQIGYTTLPENARSTRYATDVAKMLMVPIFHAHGENPEAATHVIRLACDYRMRYNKDVVIDLVCFRRYGHNEGDEPYFTQPTMYDRIRSRPSLYKLYLGQLEAEGLTSAGVAKKIETGMTKCLVAAFDTAKKAVCSLPDDCFYSEWEDFKGEYSFSTVKTGAPLWTIKAVGEKLNTVPEGFTLHRNLQKLVDRRKKMLAGKEGIDWAFGETLAFGLLLTEGIPVRLSGQDSRRGTFSQRHSVLMDQKTGAFHEPLNHLSDDQAPFACYNSLLSEAGVLGFEYGYSLARPGALTLWEAQFGDFSNGAQSIIDLYLAAGESKWQRLSGLTLLLPHGYEGLGPEHSSARPERFLQLCAEKNMQVCQPSTPAQYFHLLRRQAKARYRKPLVILTPKSLMRHPEVASSLSDLSKGKFDPVVNDPEPPDRPKKVILCSGKIYYELLARRRQVKTNPPALIRIEQFYPFPEQRIRQIVQSYRCASSWCWVQEEPENMGAGRYIRPRLEKLIGKPVNYVGRAAAASPAPGISNLHREQQNAVVDQAVGKARYTPAS
ncbi:MAG: 2-oxoglutarate dehydrogenase E1 component [bacterium]